MSKTIIVFGVIAGLILAAFLFVSIPGFRNLGSSSMATSMAVGFAVQLLTFSLIYFGIRSYRNKHNSGELSLVTGFHIGLWIAFIASTFYVIAWAIVYHYFVPNFLDQMEAMRLSVATAQGATPSQLDIIKQQVANGRELYSTWWGFSGMTLMEVFPTGFVVTLISVLLLKRNQRKPLSG